MAVNVIYSAQATTRGKREKTVQTVDGSLSVALSTPREIGGEGEPGVNAEQLFASGCAACFFRTMKYVATEHPHLAISDSAEVTATVGVGPHDSGGFGLQVDMHIQLPELDTDAANELVKRAYEICPFSNSVKSNVELNVFVEAGSHLSA
ncbi:MAG: Ohr family peroxiredoxin [Pseudomonadota bacterium]